MCLVGSSHQDLGLDSDSRPNVVVVMFANIPGGHALRDEYGVYDNMKTESVTMRVSGITVAICFAKPPSNKMHNCQDIHLLRLFPQVSTTFWKSFMAGSRRLGPIGLRLCLRPITVGQKPEEF